MKKVSIILTTVFLIACHGNETAETQPTDLDRTKNNDTSAMPIDSVNIIRTDSSDTIRLSK
jgi:hypothetical protein